MLQEMICYLKRRLSLFTFCHQREAGTPSHVKVKVKSLSRVRFFATPWTEPHGIFQARVLEWVAIMLTIYFQQRGVDNGRESKTQGKIRVCRIKAVMAPLPSPFCRSCCFPKLGDTGQGLPPPVGGELPGTPTGTESLPPVNRVCLSRCLAGKT